MKSLSTSFVMAFYIIQTYHAFPNPLSQFKQIQHVISDFYPLHYNGNEKRDSMTVDIVKVTKVICALSVATLLSSNQVLAASDQLNDNDNRMVQMAFKDFDEKRFDNSEKEFTSSIIRWKELNRPRDEIVSLLKARANVRLDNKQFDKAIEDYNEALEMMKTDGETPEGLGRYYEYPDTFVGRALAYEGIADWNAALKDYDKAISLWGGGRSVDINPYALTFRGNTLCRLGRYTDAIPDYEAASDIFNGNRDVARYSDARANLALALYEIGRTEEALKAMKDVIRKNAGYADMHVAIAADAWSKGQYIEALKEWNFACDRIDVGCDAYKDRNWVTTVRRWPPSLVKKLDQFLTREIPEALKGQPNQILAPSKK